jgi:hypothetical protein
MLTLLTSCGGNSNGSAVNTATSTTPQPNLIQEQIVTTTVVQEATTPTTGYTGVKGNISTLEVIALSNSSSDESSKIQIKSNPGLTGGNTDELAGKTFLTFDNLPMNANNETVIKTIENVSYVEECSYETRECDRVAFSRTENNSVVFAIASNKFYVLVK